MRVYRLNSGMKLALAVSIMSAGMLLPETSLAYVGPGAGLTAVGTILAFIFAALLSVVGFIWYPVKRILRKLKKPSTDAVTKTTETRNSSADQELP